MKRVHQEETDRAAMELGKANRLAHREIDRMRSKIARVESGDSSTSTTDKTSPFPPPSSPQWAFLKANNIFILEMKPNKLLPIMVMMMFFNYISIVFG